MLSKLFLLILLIIFCISFIFFFINFGSRYKKNLYLFKFQGLILKQKNNRILIHQNVLYHDYYQCVTSFKIVYCNANLFNSRYCKS